MAISISRRAAEKIQELTKDNPPQGLRIKVVGGGCSGLSYKMELGLPAERDRVFENDGAKVIVDPKSFLYLNGSEVAWSDDLTHSGFQITNPHAKRTCGCGASFST